MTESSLAAEDAAAAKTISQASLRKKRREAKIKLGGADRLNKITGLGGGIQRDPLPQSFSDPNTAPEQTTTTSSSPAADATAAPAPEQHGDPEEVDISEHFYKPPTTNRQPTPSDLPDDISDAQIRQLLLGGMGGMGGTPPPPGANPFMNSPGLGPMPGMEGMDEDPMMKMLQQMMSGGGMPGSGGANPFAGTPMEGLMGGLGGLNAGAGAPNPMQQAQQVATNKTANLWRILHAVFALGLGLYVAFSTTFTGSLAERKNASISSSGGGVGDVDTGDIERTRAYFFYVFTSVEAVLLTTRYFFDKGREPPKGWMWTVTGFLPGRVKAYAQHALRYGQILGTVRSDALVCVFVLGVCSWLRS
ncbi:uncharacterized protein GGS22DRAFT_164222 [Annulohypoxylon maeteangense]|uniref:uncharacterized protein n=1 Tax=Annulohypoxylon maeteangense TaxID=1927788 RepID=UPI0020078796|nr:uncharacterized protein GGS22DRAFT_164222 [Annulohypoxylon maeteangense]KAI0884726.1 hypothetical protein GGS22DRAFT_164222 [Annulohypoxylon maeteangense]